MIVSSPEKTWFTELSILRTVGAASGYKSIKTCFKSLTEEPAGRFSSNCFLPIRARIVENKKILTVIIRLNQIQISRSEGTKRINLVKLYRTQSFVQKCPDQIGKYPRVIMHSMENNLEKWKVGLSKTRKSTFGKIVTFFGASEIDSDSWDDLEELFIQSDLGAQTSLDIIDQLRIRSEKDGVIHADELRGLVRDELTSRLIKPPEIHLKEKPHVILIAGVNGSGKTTTIAKLGKYYQGQGQNVQFIAADTYRAAAVEQLQIWGERLKIPVTAGQQNGDPGAVVYDGIQSAVSKKKDLVLIDTAGRLHTSYNLMEELKKVHRVAGKAMPSAPHHCWIVMDATTGQNALHQAESFNETIPLDGIILVKLDSSSKGGMAFAIQDKLDLPILFAGLGENPEDLVPFDPVSFVGSIINKE